MTTKKKQGALRAAGPRVRLRASARPHFPTVDGGVLLGLCRREDLLRILVDGRKRAELWAARYWEDDRRRAARQRPQKKSGKPSEKKP